MDRKEKYVRVVVALGFGEDNKEGEMHKREKRIWLGPSMICFFLLI